MKSWHLAIACLACLATPGCRTQPAVALLERENRDLEDQVYELAGLLEDCRRENAKLFGQLEGSEGGYTKPAGPGLPLELNAPAQGRGQRESEAPRFPTELQPPAVEVPSVEIPGEEFLEKSRERAKPTPPDAPPVSSSGGVPVWPSSSEGSRDLGIEGFRHAPPQEQPDPQMPRFPNPQVPQSPNSQICRAGNAQVASITLNDRLTGGYDLDGRAGHEGITAVIEPRDAAGELVPAAASVAVAVLDPALSGDAARVARWDFTAEQVARLYRKTPLSEGIHLEMVWPAALPVHSRLHLFVRYVTDDARKLEADRGIEVDVPMLQAQRPLPAPHIARAPGPNQPAAGWQGKPSPVIRLPATEPAQTALLPAEPDSRPVELSESPPRPIAPNRQAPVWSPDRP